MKIRNIEIEEETWGQNKGKYKSRISFSVNEDVTVYANVDAIVTTELIKVLIPVFEKLTNQKYEEVVEEADSFLNKFKIGKKR